MFICAWLLVNCNSCHVAICLFVFKQDSDLRSALLLEQAAHCFINMKSPMVRKFAFHMILAGHRYSKAGQVRFMLVLEGIDSVFF